MASIKVKFRSSKVPGKAGIIYYQLSHRGASKQVTTAYRLPPEYWDAVQGEISSAASVVPALSGYRRRVSCDLFLLRSIIRGFEDSGQRYTLTDVVSSFRASVQRSTILSYLTRRIDLLKRQRRLGTARNYLRARNSFGRFLEWQDLPLGLLSADVVMAYSDYLSGRGLVRNSISFYMRILRAAYNAAVREGLVEQRHPFRGVYTGVDGTRKRALDEQILLRLQRLDLRRTPSLSMARDLFIFSFSTRGMAFVDMAFLRKSDIRDGTLSYTRRKTGQRLHVGLEPCARIIIERYGTLRPESPYLFPLLTSEDLPTAYRQYRTALGYYNDRLRRLGRLLGEPLRMSSYVARHSWATAARKRDIPLSVISAGMGHTSERTTRIYLDSLADSAVDRANHEILRALNEI